MMLKNYCCKDMDYYLNLKCDVHEDPFECPDNIVCYVKENHFSKKKHEFGIIIHDGGHSYIKIDYCPWCGSPLKL